MDVNVITQLHWIIQSKIHKSDENGECDITWDFMTPKQMAPSMAE